MVQLAEIQKVMANGPKESCPVSKHPRGFICEVNEMRLIVSRCKLGEDIMNIFDLIYDDDVAKAERCNML